MNNAYNVRLANKDNKSGSVANYFSNLKNLVQPNDGSRSFSIRTRDCHAAEAPFTENLQTQIEITHGDHQISQISDGFLTIKVTLMVKLNTVLPNIDDPHHVLKLFIGLKSSNQIWRDMSILNNNQTIGYSQQEMCREGFAYSVPMHQQEKKTKKFIHSLYENVQQYSTSVCGTYVNLNDIKDGQAHPVEIEMNLPFDHLLALQAFDLYPNAVCGELALKGWLDHQGFVWCMVNPMQVKEVKEYLESDSIDFVCDDNLAGMYKHEFTQIDNSATIINSFQHSTVTIGGESVDKVTAQAGEVGLMCTGMTVNMMKSTMYGFNVNEAALESIRETLQTPIIIPSQYLEYATFTQTANAAGIQTSTNLPVRNCTCISVVFPKYANDITVLTNPIYQNLQLTVNGKVYPDEPVSSLGGQFLQEQLIASDLQFGLECTKEFEDSYIMEKNDSDGSRFNNTLRDASSFMWNVQLERGNAGYVFDGVESNGSNVQIQLKGSPVFTGAQDTYYNINAAGTIHPPAPQLWLCRDTYFEISTNGVVYHDKGTPYGY